MRPRTIYSIIIVLFAQVFFACSSDPKVDPVDPRQPRLTITWSPPTLLPAAGSTQLRFSTDEAWHIETAAGSTLGSELQAVRSHIAADKIGGQNLKMRIMTIVF